MLNRDRFWVVSLCKMTTEMMHAGVWPFAEPGMGWPQLQPKRRVQILRKWHYISQSLEVFSVKGGLPLQMVWSFPVLENWLCWALLLTENAQLPFSFMGTQWCLLLWTVMLKKRVCGTEWSCYAFGYQAPSCEPSQKQRLVFTAWAWLLLSLSPWPRPPLEGIDGWFRQELLFRACEHSGLSCVRVYVSLGIRAALMSALVHLKAAQDDFMQSPQRCLHKKRCFRNVNSVWGQIFLCWSLLIQDEAVKM